MEPTTWEIRLFILVHQLQLISTTRPRSADWICSYANLTANTSTALTFCVTNVCWEPLTATDCMGLRKRLVCLQNQAKRYSAEPAARGKKGQGAAVTRYGAIWTQSAVNSKQERRPPGLGKCFLPSRTKTPSVAVDFMAKELRMAVKKLIA